MNIFKVLASGKKSFQEETASAILAWLLNPYMDHGLGFVFLSKFIGKISNTDKNKDLKLRLKDEDSSDFWIDLEIKAGESFVDIVFKVDNILYAIENKIYLKSAQDNTQLSREYKGLREKYQLPINFIYLVPERDNNTKNNIENLQIEIDKKIDKTKYFLWKEDNELPSVSQILSEIINEDLNGTIDPVPEMTKNILKSLKVFIENDFKGYDYEKSLYINNPAAEDILSISELKDKKEGYVGIQYGINGLLRMDLQELQSKKFQYTTQDIVLHKKNWININTFKSIVEAIEKNQFGNISWDGKFSSKVIYKISKNYKNLNNTLYIGIKGGEKALENMNIDEINEKSWSIKTNKKPTNQWIDYKTFTRIFDEKVNKINI